MDAVFYNDSGDRFYGGKQMSFSLNGLAGTAPLNNQIFKFLQLSETNGVLSWPEMTITPAGGDAPLTFALVPPQFIGTGAQILRGYVTIRRTDGLFYSTGEIYIDVANATLNFWIGEVRAGDATEYLSYRGLRVGLEYEIAAGSIMYERIFA
jgi:hypothetical protein